MTIPSEPRPGILRRTAVDFAFLLPVLPIVIVGFVTTFTLFVTGVSLAIIWVGVPLAAVALACARWFGALELGRLALTGRAPIAHPDWRAPRSTGFLGWLKGVFGDSQYWAYLAHSALVSFILGILTWSIAITWFAVAVGGPSYWFWAAFIPRGDGDSLWMHDTVLRFFDPGFVRADTIDGLILAENIFYLVVGAVFLVTLPLVARLLVDAHWLVAKGMLGERRSAQLERAVAATEASRGAAIAAEDSGLRRLERDIHDGPQQRLLRLQYDLARAERRLTVDSNDGGATAVDSTDARALVAGALQQSKDALDELRDLSRGLAPPILQDRGLVAAIRSAAARSTVPVSVTFELESDDLSLAEIERSVYFVVSELLANVDKHAAATGADVALRFERSSGAASLLIEVRDDGQGGATIVDGHGLAGLRDRLEGLRGTLRLYSPAGGPTSAIATIPLDSPTLER